MCVCVCVCVGVCVCVCCVCVCVCACACACVRVRERRGERESISFAGGIHRQWSIHMPRSITLTVCTLSFTVFDLHPRKCWYASHSLERPQSPGPIGFPHRVPRGI